MSKWLLITLPDWSLDKRSGLLVTDGQCYAGVSNEKRFHHIVNGNMQEQMEMRRYPKDVIIALESTAIHDK
ncbi:hypothetical protein KIN20_017322 [Parelaphostrongylus tenuis]|uniref:Uncharacterized protein n=1 Tax=Parelaphostrongylus tenuis TaxID=148309 RepID=A0AAD5N2G1_PARTN|nr:hypothetical protein KIN20_017322 [Parelaphostrongylus tenuis]